MAAAAPGDGADHFDERWTAPFTRLDARQARVAGLVAAGRSDVEIADALDLGPGEVEALLAVIFEALGIGSRTELALLAAQRPEADA